MGRTIRDIVEDNGGSMCIVRRESWSEHDYAVVHRVSGHGAESEAFGFTYHHRNGAGLDAGSIRLACTESWQLVRVLGGRVDYGRYGDRTSRMLRAAVIIEANGIRSWKGFREYLDRNRDADTGMFELYDCMRDRDQRRTLARRMGEARSAAVATA